MKFGIKIVDNVNITHFTHIVATVSKLCAKSANEKSCLLKLTDESFYFILPEFSSSSSSASTGRTSFWISIDPKILFEFCICEGKTPDEHMLLLEIQPESLLRALKSSPNIKMIRIKLTKRQSTCLTVELELHSMTSKLNSRTITHDIPIRILSKVESNNFQEPDVNRTNLSIEMPPLKLLKHMIERMKCLSEYVYLEATNQGSLTLKIEADAVSVCSYFRNLTNLPIKSSSNNQSQDEEIIQEDDEEIDDDNQIKTCSVRLSLKKLSEFINGLQFQPTKIICNFSNRKYAHFFVLHEDDLVLQYLISSVLS
jgi:HUS1 checkpoint protein